MLLYCRLVGKSQTDMSSLKSLTAKSKSSLKNSMSNHKSWNETVQPETGFTNCHDYYGLFAVILSRKVRRMLSRWSNWQVKSQVNVLQVQIKSQVVFLNSKFASSQPLWLESTCLLFQQIWRLLYCNLGHTNKSSPLKVKYNVFYWIIYWSVKFPFYKLPFIYKHV